MANLNIHPAPGLGDLTQGFFVVPQNPLQMATEGVSRVPSLGEFMAGSFVVPQNPFWAYSAGQVQPLGQGVAGTPMVKRPKKGMGCADGGGCGCGGSCGGHGGGLGQLDFSSMSAFTSSIGTVASEDSLGMGMPNWAYAAAAVGAYVFLFGHSTGPSRVSRARKAIKSY